MNAQGDLFQALAPKRLTKAATYRLGLLPLAERIANTEASVAGLLESADRCRLDSRVERRQVEAYERAAANAAAHLTKLRIEQLVSVLTSDEAASARTETAPNSSAPPKEHQ